MLQEALKDFGKPSLQKRDHKGSQKFSEAPRDYQSLQEGLPKELSC